MTLFNVRYARHRSSGTYYVENILYGREPTFGVCILSANSVGDLRTISEEVVMDMARENLGSRRGPLRHNNLRMKRVSGLSLR